jgi:hypothetical protein
VFHRLPEGTRVRTVNTALGPAGAWWLKERLLGRQATLLTGHTVREVEPVGDGLRLRVEREDGSAVNWTTEHLIAGTGYRVDLDRLAFLGPRLRARLHRVGRAPALSPSFEASAPGLYFVGLASAYSLGPMMRFVYGADYAARRLVGRLLAQSQGRAPPCAPAKAWRPVSGPIGAGARRGTRPAWGRSPGRGPGGRRRHGRGRTSSGPGPARTPATPGVQRTPASP